MKEKRFKNIIGMLFAFIEWCMVILLLILIILICFQRFSNTHNFFGYRIYVVASGSMIPTYNIGDTLLIKEMDASKINVGDAVTYIGDDVGIDGMIITHQVQEVEIDESGKYYFHTKGIANNIEDPIVDESQVIGKVVYKFFFLSFIGSVTTDKLLLFCFIAIPCSFLIALEIIKLIYKKDEDDEEDSNEDDNLDDSQEENLNDSQDKPIENEGDNKKDTEDEKNDIMLESSAEEVEENLDK